MVVFDYRLEFLPFFSHCLGLNLELLYSMFLFCALWFRAILYPLKESVLSTSGSISILWFYYRPLMYTQSRHPKRLRSRLIICLPLICFVWMKMDLMEKMHNYKSEINKRKHGCSSHCGPPSKGMRLTNSIMERCSPAEFPFNAPILG